MAEPTGNKSKNISTKNAFQVMRKAKHIKEKIDHNAATPEEIKEYEEHYAPLVAELEEIFRPVVAGLAGVAETVGKAGEKLQKAITEAVNEARRIYDSGKYYTINVTDDELIIIVDGKEWKREKQRDELDIEEIIAKYRRLKTRSYIIYSMYEVFKDFQDEPQGQLQLQEFIKNDFIKVAQAAHTNQLSRTLIKPPLPEHIDLTGKARIETKDMTIYIANYSKLLNGARTSAVKLLDFFMLYITENNLFHAPSLRISLKEYMQIRGLEDTKRNRYKTKKQVENDMQLLKSLSIRFVDKRRKNKGDYLEVDIAGAIRGIVNGIIYFEFSKPFIDSLPSNQFMLLPPKAFSTDDANYPHSFYFIRRMMEHKRVNVGNQNENVITGRTLIEGSPLEKHIECEPKYFKRQLLEPFMNNMNYVEEHCGCEWSFQELESTPCGEYTQEKIPATIEELLNAKIIFEMVNYPDEKMEKTKKKKEKYKAMSKERAALNREKKKVEALKEEVEGQAQEVQKLKKQVIRAINSINGDEKA